VYFSSLTGLKFRRLKLAFNACMRYVFGLRRFDYIREFSRSILGYTLFEYRHPIEFRYKWSQMVLERVSFMNDLGFIIG
jgi:hypothetical protein